nr:UDP-N-acetylmuramoyl-tripeptide--D-alanyl-D-alanine ligase [bacterium]
MKPMTVQQVVSACGGTFLGPQDMLSSPISGIAIDNRKVSAGNLFIPIRGERFDGHDFIPAAFETGALVCLSSRPLEGDYPCIRVADTQDALQDIAAFYRGLFAIKAIGITGSVGKTTTKEMIASVLSQRFRVCKSPGNLNNQIGVPLTLFGLQPGDQVAVIEMGTNHFGEIDRLARMVQPDVCFLTNIGEAHIEHLGSRAGILRAKCEMLAHMKPGGRVYVNGDDDMLRTLARSRGDVVTFGLDEGNDIRALDVQDMGLEGMHFTACVEGRRLEVLVPSPGRHMVLNALAAIAAGRELGLDTDEIRRGIAAYQPVGGRMKIERAGGITVLNDVYNANPGSVRAAIDVLAHAQGRKVAILGDMLELGEQAMAYHRQIGEYAAAAGLDALYCVGPLSQSMAQGARQAGMACVQHAADQQGLLLGLPGQIMPGDTVLVKASRGMGLEKTVAFLLEHAQQP